jgi:large subunit ribosomal protein L18
MKLTKTARRRRIQHRIRKKVSGTRSTPRLSVFRSNKNIDCQLIDDVNGFTIASATSKGVKTTEGGKIEQAKQVGQLIAEKAKANNIEKVILDRGGYLYHGRVKAMADAVREAGIEL